MVKITKENFNQYKDKLEELIADNLPTTAKEFSDFCDNVFGFSVLDMAVMTCGGVGSININYIIRDPYAETIESKEIYKLWKNHYRELEKAANEKGSTLRIKEPLKILFEAVFGRARVGGIASCFYGWTEGEELNTKQLINVLNWGEIKICNEIRTRE